MIEICSLGGYIEIGRNMTAVKYKDTVVILDLGLHLDAYIRCTDQEDVVNISYEKLAEAGAVPKLDPIKEWMKDVKMLIPSHAHLDHIGAVPYIAPKFNAPMLCTPFTAAVIEAIVKDSHLRVDNKIIVLSPNSIYPLNDDVSIEFIHVTHSTPQTVLVAIHTPDGIVMYGNDFKLDPFPVLGKASNLERMKELSQENIIALVCDCTRAREHGKTPSESVARELLRDVLLGVEAKGKAIVVSTFSSHIARLKSIIECGKLLNRKILFLGRSLGKYTEAAEAINLLKFSDSVEIARYPDHIQRALVKVMKEGQENYLLVVTGHQAEPGSVLSRMAKGETVFKFSAGDHMIFSSQIIPTPVNIENRKNLDEELRSKGVRIFNDVHVSGHGGREDLRELLTVLQPKHIIPAHGFPVMKDALSELAQTIGYKKENIHMVKQGDILKLE